ncbi:MAG: DUF547 domain-containing protein [Rhodothermales bacterium]|nr:DUF547 domain-containing protein [Rhodothermales bacterium]
MWTDLLRSSTLVAVVVALSANGTAPLPVDLEADLSSLLQAVVSDEGFVDYDQLRGPLNQSFEKIIGLVENYDGPLENDDQKKAFWINAYNVHMLNNIVRNPEARDIIKDNLAEEFFKSDRLAAGYSISLDEIEHTILRRQPAARHSDLAVSRLDPRIHVGLNCAAISCPPLLPVAFTEKTVDAFLQQAMTGFVDSEKYFRAEGDIIVLSSLLDWFGPDFEQDGERIGDYLLRYMSKDRPGYTKLRSALINRSADDLRNSDNIEFEYLWFVNDIKLQ